MAGFEVPADSFLFLKRAQRLSASTKTKPGKTQTGPIFLLRAQRLSASPERTLASTIMLTSSGLTCSTPFGIYGKNTPSVCHPLAACRRAQRLSASTERTPAQGAGVKTYITECSTPFGIYGKNTPPSVVMTAGVGVLNAFRHLRKEHDMVAALSRWLWKSAQRLSASTERTPKQGAAMRRKQNRCSTPFGIYGKNTWYE